MNASSTHLFTELRDYGVIRTMADVPAGVMGTVKRCVVALYVTVPAVPVVAVTVGVLVAYPCSVIAPSLAPN
jgi:hypothetical protein